MRKILIFIIVLLSSFNHANTSEKTVKILFKVNDRIISNVDIFNEAKYMHLNRGIGLVWKDLSNTSLKPENFILSRIATQGVI